MGKLNPRLTPLPALVALLVVAGCSPSPSAPPAKAQSATDSKPPALPTDFLGLTLGQPIVMPECKPLKGSRELYAGYWDQPTLPCWQSSLGFDGYKGEKPSPPEDGEYAVEFGLKGVPAGVESEARFTISGGVLQAIDATTQPDRQAELQALLSGKFGKPSTSNVSEQQNAYGAQYQAIDSVWADPSTVIIFNGRLDLDSGYVLARTRAYHDAETTRLKSLSAPSF